MIDERCFYFEPIDFNHEEAQENCKEKLKNFGCGKLYEPNSLGGLHLL